MVPKAVKGFLKPLWVILLGAAKDTIAKAIKGLTIASDKAIKGY